MKNITKHLLAVAGVTIMVGVFPHTSAAQGNFDPVQFRQRQMDMYRERLDVKSDEAWNKFEPLIAKVMDGQRETRIGAGGFGAGAGRGGRGRAGGGGDGNAAQGTNTNRNRFGAPPSPEAEALQKALNDKASAEEIKTKLAKLREARQAKEDALAKAQDDLRKALSPRQEASAVVAGLLK